MKQITKYIKEGLKIGSKTKIHTPNELSNNIKKRILDELCEYFLGKGSYQNKTYIRLDIVNKFFNKNIYKYFDDLDLWEDMSDYFKINTEDFIYFIKNNNKEIYKEIDNYVF